MKHEHQVMGMQMERVTGDWSHHMQEGFDVQQMADWVNWLAAPEGWQVIAHLTFPWESSLDSTRRCYERFMQRKLCRVSYFYAVEENPSRDGHHVHALWGDAKNVYRKEVWASWFTQFGIVRDGKFTGARARIEPVRSVKDVSDYCSKYVTKACAWWNVKLQGHRYWRMHGREFALTGCSVNACSGASPGIGSQVESMEVNRLTSCVLDSFRAQRYDPSGSEGVEASAAVAVPSEVVVWCADEAGIFHARHLKGNA